MKKISILFLLVSFCIAVIAQEKPEPIKTRNADRKETRRQKINAMIKQDEEGVLVFSRQSILGLQFRSNGYGVFYELGRTKTRRKTNIYRLDFTEIKNPKEEKLPSGGFIFGNPYIYGKKKLGFVPSPHSQLNRRGRR